VAPLRYADFSPECPLIGVTGCERLTVKAVLLTQLGHSLAFGKRAFQEPNLLENKGVP